MALSPRIAAAEPLSEEVRAPDTPPTYAVAKVSARPKIDGKLDDEAWRAAPPLGRFYLDTGDGPMRLRTVTRFVRDDTYLYMAVDSELPGASDVPIQKGTRDNVNYGGETIELFLDADRSSPGYVQIIFDMSGAFTDMLDGMNQWNGDIIAATSVDKTGWKLEVRLRMSDLGGSGRVDKHLWGANVCRSSDEGSGSWADIRDTFQQPDAFGLLTFADQAAVEALPFPPPMLPDYTPIAREALQELLTPADATTVLAKLKCPLPKDPADRAITQARIDRLADKLQQQAAEPKVDLTINIQTLYGQLMDLVEQLRDGRPYTSRQRGWFECAIVSPVDDSAQPCNLFVPHDYDKHPDRRYALEVQLHAGGGTHGGAGYRRGLDRDVTDRLILHPLSRGGHAGYGSVAGNDVINHIRDVMTRYRIDPDAVHVTGESMGGFGSFDLPSVYPDVFATSRPICGGGFDNPVEQMCNVATFVHHGMQDATVPALYSQISTMRMQAEGCPVQLYIHDGAGHGVGLAARKITNWSNVSHIRRDPCPRTVVLTGGMVQLKRAYWLSILRYQDIHKSPYLKATFAGPNHLVLADRNVAWAKVSLPCKWIDADRPLQITDGDGLRWTEVTPGDAKAIYIRFEAGRLSAATEPAVDFEDPAVYTGGGAAAMFCLGRPVRIVYGTAGSAEQTEALAKLAKEIRRWGWACGDYWSGGYPILKDSEVNEQTLKTCDLVLLGTPASHSLLAKMADRLPVSVANGRVTVQCDPAMAWPTDQVRWSLFYRNPLSPAQRIWWFGGFEDREAFNEIAQVSCGSVLSLYPPELIVQSRPKGALLATAFLDGQWQLARPGPLQPARQIWPRAADLFDQLNQRFAEAFAADAGLVSVPVSQDQLDWNSLTTGEALLMVAPGPLLRATVSGQAIVDSRDAFVKRISRRIKNVLLSWGGKQPETFDPKADYQVLASPWGGLVHQAQATGLAVRNCRLVPADQVRAVQERYLREKGVLPSSTQPAKVDAGR